MNRMMIMALCLVLTSVSCTTAVGENKTGEFVTSVKGGKKIKKNVAVAEFTKIELRGGVDVVFRQTNGGKPVVTVVGRKQDVGHVRISSDGRTLVVTDKLQQGWQFFNDDDDLKVYVSAPDLTGVSVIGSGDFDVAGKLDTDNLMVAVKGSGDVDMKNVICDNVIVKVYGSGDVDIDNLVAQCKADVSVQGSGDVEIGFTRTGLVRCSVYGSGDVKLKGHVKDFRHEIKGSGEIDASNLKRW